MTLIVIALFCMWIFMISQLKKEISRLHKEIEKIDLELYKTKVKEEYYRSECELNETEKFLAEFQIEQMINERENS